MLAYSRRKLAGNSKMKISTSIKNLEFDNIELRISGKFFRFIYVTTLQLQIYDSEYAICVIRVQEVSHR